MALLRPFVPSKRTGKALSPRTNFPRRPHITWKHAPDEHCFAFFAVKTLNHKRRQGIAKSKEHARGLVTFLGTAKPKAPDVTWVTLAEVGTNATLPQRQENQPFARGS